MSEMVADDKKETRKIGKLTVIATIFVILLAIYFFTQYAGKGVSDKNGIVDVSGNYVAEAQKGMTLKLNRDGTYTASIEESGISVIIDGTYRQEGDYVYFYVQGQPSGKAEIQDEVLINRGEGINWIKEGWTTPIIQRPEIKSETKPQLETPSLPTQELSPSETVEAFWAAVIQKDSKEASKYFRFPIDQQTLETKQIFQEISRVEILGEKVYSRAGTANVDYKIIYKNGEIKTDSIFLQKNFGYWQIAD